MKSTLSSRDFYPLCLKHCCLIASSRILLFSLSNGKYALQTLSWMLHARRDCPGCFIHGEIVLAFSYAERLSCFFFFYIHREIVLAVSYTDTLSWMLKTRRDCPGCFIHGEVVLMFCTRIDCPAVSCIEKLSWLFRAPMCVLSQPLISKEEQA